MIPSLIANGLNPNQGQNQSGNLQSPRYNRGVLGRLGGSPGNTLLGSLYDAWQQHQQNKMDQQMTAGMDHQIATEDNGLSPNGQMSPQAMGDTSDLVEDSFARGKIVTSPTVAMIGEKGPEAVVPLSVGPHDKTSGAMITDQPIKTPDTLGGTPRARYRHAGGPVGLSRTRPLSNDLPLKPNTAVR